MSKKNVKGENGRRLPVPTKQVGDEKITRDDFDWDNYVQPIDLFDCLSGL